MQPQQTHPIYEFGDFQLDVLRRVLLSRSDRKPVDITGRALDALIFLIERRGQLADKKSLIAALWPHVIVEEGNLTQTIHTLRRVLGEQPGDHRYIATVPGRGYTFVADVRVRDARAEIEAPQQPPPQAPTPQAPTPPQSAPQQSAPQQATTPAAPPRKRRMGWALGATSLVAIAALGAVLLATRTVDPPARKTLAVANVPPPTTAAPSIAVLPFVDLSDGAGDSHFADGLSEEILNTLAHSGALRVIARTSSFSFKDQNADIRTIAQRLGVTHVLEGSVRRSGKNVHITAQLIDAATSTTIWSATCDRDMRNLFPALEEIAVSVVFALHVKNTRSPVPNTLPTNEEAYEHYLQGRYLVGRRGATDVAQAKAHFEEAVRLDPNYASAWAALAGVYFVAHQNSIAFPNLMARWGEAARRAVALAPDLPEVQTRAGQYEWAAGHPDVAEAHWQRAVILDPEAPIVLSARAQEAVCAGHITEAIDLQKRIVASDPLSAVHRGNLAAYLTAAGRYADARAQLERALELSPNGAQVAENTADVLMLQGDTDEALKSIAHIEPGIQRDKRLALVAFARGDAPEGQAILDRLIKLASNPKSDFFVNLAVADIYAATKDTDHAFQWLKKAVARARAGRPDMSDSGVCEELNVAPFLNALRSDPRWEKVVPKPPA